MARKRKTPSGFIYIAPEIIEYERTLQTLGIDADQLISLAILVGTDFNPGGVHGIGPKKALALVKEKRYPIEIFRSLEGRMNFDWKEVFEIFKKPNVKKEKIKFPKLDEKKIKKILVEEHDFSLDRIEKQLEKLKEGKGKAEQKTLF